MRLTILKPSKALNLAFRKVKPQREHIETFKSNLINLLDQIDIKESEEFHKNIISKFLHDTYYDTRFYINTKHRNDLVIHNDKTAKSSVGVIIEAKSPINKSEMLKVDDVNTKAFHELVLYYLRERITHKNLEVKHLVVTNINEWFIFDANTFEKLFAQNKGLVKQFDDFESGRLAGRTTDFFYKEIADPFIASITQEVEFTYFDIRDYQKPLRNDDKKDDNKLISLFKLLSPEHLLKLPFTNDSNTLDKRFYSELLHIIGLSESKEGGKKLIGRNKEGQRNSGSILEDTVIQLDSLDKISRLDKPSQYGNTHQERLFNVALELSITWINRILFLKLLEAQLISYHKGDKSYSFLNQDRIKEYDDLNILFFQVLARKFDERNSDVKQLYEKVPYLNSSLFEPTEMEQVTLFISNLKDDKAIPVISTTVLKDKQGKKRTGSLSTLEYLFEFLNAYDFSSEGSEEIQEDNKTLINASVLGLIFEKINGYKDGSFFTPGFITMYMCRETIRKAVVQKFNEVKNWNSTDFNELYDKIEDRNEANDIVNSIKICDPAVGSGHFLVSALNEMIAVKNDLKILQDRTGRRLKEYQVEIVNDELIVTDEEGDLFDYNPANKESQRIQETLFHERQTIIENCLFGVDININSVKICRLRLWIELLKSAYYRTATELETLPNIDINIKCGNSLVSRFPIDVDLKKALKKSKWTIDSYRIAVDTYRNAESKEQKRDMERLIADIKSDFRSEISLNDPKLKKLRKLSGDLFQMTNQIQLFEKNKKEAAAWNKKVDSLTVETKKLETEIEEIKANKIFENAFEWRFEFPEVLNDEGDFVGFDVVIGNPPYISSKGENFKESFKKYALNEYKTSQYQIDTYILFIEKSLSLISQNGVMSLITPNSWLNNLFLGDVRKFFLNNMALIEISSMPSNVFEDAVVDTVIFQSRLFKYAGTTVIKKCLENEFLYQDTFVQKEFLDNDHCSINIQLDKLSVNLLRKIENISMSLESFTSIARGVGVYHKRVGHTKEIIAENPYQSKIIQDETFVPYLRGKNVTPYLINWNNDSFISYGKWLAEPRDPKFFDGGRILLRQIPGVKLIAAYIDSLFITDQSVFIAKFEEESLNPRAVLGIICSKLMIYYFRNKYSEFDTLFPKVKLQHFKNFPISKNLKETQTEVAELVDKIEALKLHGENVSRYESQIDQLVYHLYDLSEEEIAIIEAV